MSSPRQPPTPSRPVDTPTAPRRALRAVIWLPGLAVALGAAAATAHGLFQVALAARVPVGIAWLYPLITDGLALVAYAATARLSGSAARYAWAVVVLAAGLSGLAQAAYLATGATLDAPPALRFGIGAWPAVAAAIVAHLLYLLLDHETPDTATRSTADSPDASPTDSPPVPSAIPEPRSPAATGAASQREPDPEPGVQAAGSSRTTAAPDPGAGVHPDPADGVQPDHHAPSRSSDSAPGVRPDEPSIGRGTGRSPGAAPRDRARAAAVRHATRHGALPTVTELEAAAHVSRGTAATVLRSLRNQPTPLHLITNNTPDTPDTPKETTQP